jgi:hypothetical protein
MVLTVTSNSLINPERFRHRIGEVIAPGTAKFRLAIVAQSRHKARMDKHSRAFGRPGKGKRRRLPPIERKRHSGKEVIPNELVDLATDAIRDGQTTVETFIAPFHPDLRFKAFRAYAAAMLAFMAKWRR